MHRHPIRRFGPHRYGRWSSWRGSAHAHAALKVLYQSSSFTASVSNVRFALGAGGPAGPLKM